MSEKIYIGVAWPYANGSLHLGHIAGCYLPADIFARFNRLIGNDVLMVSGSDEHGTPITITADKEGITPQDVVDRFNKEHTENMKQFGISFDLFTRTTTNNHEQVVQDIFKTLYDKKYVYTEEVQEFYCKNCERFLPDRYIEGTCPDCGHEHARGDQCDECGNILDPEELTYVTCKICGSAPELRNTEHFFFSLSSFEELLLKWLENKKYWKSSVLKFTQNWLKEGLQDRAITRDITWGIKVPIKGYEDKRIYVWFEAVCGYLSASKEWAQRQGKPEKWKEWWYNPDSKHYYFLAKDNIPFHSIIWPSIISGYNSKLQLPYDIPANEYLRLQGEQFSKSKGLGIWVPDIIKKLDVDAVRYYLSINMPENKDSNWLWDDFIGKNNDELVGTYGNFIHRVITFTQKNYGEIPKANQFDEEDEKAIELINQTLEKVKESLNLCKFKQGLKEAMSLAKYGNIYFNDKQPWTQIKTDRDKCAITLHICLKIAQALSICLAPYIPFSSDKLWHQLGFTESIHNAKWDDALKPLNVGFKLEKPKLLFKKLELEEFIMNEDPFSRLDLRVAEIINVRKHPEADKLYHMQIDVGALGKREIVAGMRPYYTEDELKGKKIIIVANLEPAKIRGIKSYGMLLAATDSQGKVTLLNPGDVKSGNIVGVKDVPHMPDKTLKFDEFLKVKIKTDENQKAVYHGKILHTEIGDVITDKPIGKNANVS
jgi:methionyl-tRNA synthetase